MHGNIPMRQSIKVLGASLLVFSLGACSQMTKHSNTLVFATNTVSGLKVGADEKQLPTIQIAHVRQEAAFVPLLANTGADGGGGDLIPCPSASALKGDTPQDVTMNDIEKCKFVATHDTKSKDAYSTLASFGSKKAGSVDAEGKASGESAIAQYFATGIAAQYLAVTGGANVVQAGGDTKAKAEAAAKAAVAVTKAEAAKAGAIKQYTGGKDVALVMLGNDGTVNLDTTSSAFTSFEPKMGAGCNAASLDRVFKRKSAKETTDASITVGEYLEQILAHRPYCFDPLNPSDS
jgi:hypothetical protein